ncbi:amino acid synthesis family protein, partial [Mesorhizobium sp. M2D.F.Ca.ET.145.01.1.1]
MNYSSEVERDYDVRGWYASVQESRHDGGQPGETLVKVATGVVIRN